MLGRLSKKFRYIASRIAFRLALRNQRRALAQVKSQVFSNTQVCWDDKGFYALNPMPSQERLDHYYGQSYWVARGDQKVLLRDRDLDHLLALRPFLSSMNANKDRPPKLLNFGAGHGGISHLLFAAGFSVLNCEPSKSTSTLDGANWSHVHGIDHIDQNARFDFIYSSHSLEHVQNIDTMMEKLDRLLSPGGLCFFEVPNCRQTNTQNPVNGGQDGSVLAPHTYYFTTDFFRRLPYQCLLLGTYSQAVSPNPSVPNEDGEVIRYLGRKI